MANGHGGQRQPARPAAVSNPQTGARTDGGAGSKSQPLRVPSGGGYGDRKAATEQQQGAPLATASGSSTVAGGSGAGQEAAPAAPVGDAFGPTQRPHESPSMGVGGPANDALARNPQAALRVMYAKFPHPAIARLIDWSGSTGKPIE
jgi:hypothetical protein